MNVTLIVSNGGCADTITNVVTINDTPQVSLTHIAAVCSGESVDFVNSSTTGSGVTYSWDFGNGSSPSTSSAYSPQGVVYNNAGTKTVTLTVR